MLPKLTRKILTKKHGATLRGRLRGLTFVEIAKREGVSEAAVKYRFRVIKPFLNKSTLARLKRDHTPEIVSLRLSGKTLKQIRAKTGLNEITIRRLLKKAALGMKKEDAEKLAVGGTRAHPSRVTRVANQHRATTAFFEEINSHPNPYGAMKRAARRAGLKGRWKHLTYHLDRAGINWQAEVRRRRLALALKVAETMHLPREEASRNIGISTDTLDIYRAKIKRLQPPAGKAADVPEEITLNQFFEKVRRGEITLPVRTKQFPIEHIKAIEETRRLDARPKAERVIAHIPNMEATIDTITAFRRQFAKLLPVQQVLVAQRFGILMNHPHLALVEHSILSSKERAKELEAAYATLEQHPLVKKLI